MHMLHKTAWIALLSGVLACASDSGSDDGNTGNTDGGTGADTGATSAPNTTGMSMSGGMTSSPGTDGSDGGTSAAGSTGPAEPQPDGSSCTENEECISGKCFVVSILGGICGECLTDTDCPDGGCSLPNPISNPPVGAHCNMGEPGAGCETDDVCQMGVCATILDVPGVLTAKTCSDCIADADCTDGQLCSPTYDVLNISGQKLCVEPGSVPNGEGCDFMGTGDTACMSGLCAAVDIMSLLMVGVCGDCEVDADCTAPDVCIPASIDTATGTVTPPTCGAA